MSQIYKNSLSSPLPPSVATSYVTDNGTAVPAANVLIIHGDDSTENNVNGIIAKGGTPATPASNEVDIILTNRFRQTTTTAGATTSTMTVLSALIDGVYTLDMKIAGSATAGGPAANGYTLVGAVRVTGGVAVLLPDQALDSFEETIGAFASLGVSGATITVTVTGVAGINFNWAVVGEYMYIV